MRRLAAPAGALLRGEAIGFGNAEKQAQGLKGSVHPLVRTHPVTGEPSLYICDTYAAGIDGMTTHEAKPLIANPLAFEKFIPAGPDDVIVVLLPDGGRGYLSKVFNDEWLREHGMLERPAPSATVAELLRDQLLAVHLETAAERPDRLTRILTKPWRTRR